MGTERDRYPAAERTAQPGTLQKLKNNGTAGGEARSRGGSRRGSRRTLAATNHKAAI